MKDNFKIFLRKEKENNYFRTVIFMKENIKMESQMALENILGKMELYIQVNSLMGIAMEGEILLQSNI